MQQLAALWHKGYLGELLHIGNASQPRHMHGHDERVRSCAASSSHGRDRLPQREDYSRRRMGNAAWDLAHCRATGGENLHIRQTRRFTEFPKGYWDRTAVQILVAYSEDCHHVIPGTATFIQGTLRWEKKREAQHPPCRVRSIDLHG